MQKMITVCRISRAYYLRNLQSTSPLSVVTTPRMACDPGYSPRPVRLSEAHATACGGPPSVPYGFSEFAAHDSSNHYGDVAIRFASFALPKNALPVTGIPRK